MSGIIYYDTMLRQHLQYIGQNKHKCKECGKAFKCVDGCYVYKIEHGQTTDYFCSYTCYKKAQKQNYRK